MPKYRVTTNERSYDVNVEMESKRKCTATIEGKTLDCVCDRTEEFTAWSITREGTKTHAKSRSLSSDTVEVWAGGLPFQFSVISIGRNGLGIPSLPTKAQSGEIRATMPGRVTSILVKTGEHVNVGTPLLILEAMKMQNEIVSPKSGQVASIRVQEGTTVKKESILLEIK
jgi:biotin carboxyl carrier protein